MSIRLPLAVVILLLTGSSFASAGGDDPERLESLRNYLQQMARAFRLPGLAVAVVGPESPPETVIAGQSVSPSSSFVIGSCSKTITALATLIALREAGISVETPVEKILPAIHFAGQARAVTLRNLLEHRSGLSRRQGFDRLPALAELERADKTLHPGGEPDDEYRYSNLNYAILGIVIEQVSGERYNDFVERRIFAPLGMVNSYAGPAPANADLAPEHQYWFGFPRRVAPFESDPQSIPAGFLRCSIDDLARFWQCLMNEGRLGGQQVFPHDLIALMATPASGSEYGYGMGLARSYFPPVGHVLAHEGATPTAYACTGWFPDQQYALLLLTNVNLYDPLTDPGSEIFKNAIRVLEGMPLQSVRPYKIWLRYALLVGAIYAILQLLWRLRATAADGWQLRLPAGRRARWSLLLEVLLPVAIWWGLLRWTEISLFQFLTLEPDLAWTLLALTVVGIFNGCLKKLKASEANVG